MVNLDNFIISQKLVWTKRLYAAENPGQSFCHLQCLLIYFITWDLHGQNLYQKKTSNLFWKDVFKAWYCYLNQVTFKATELLTVPLWYNSLISTQKIFSPHWYQARISMPLDIVKPDSRILSTMELRQTFGLRTNFLEYHSIERVLKRLLKQTSPNSYTRPVFPHT